MKNLFILGIVSGMAAVAATPAVKDTFTPATGGNVHLAGRAGESADACIRARAYSDWARGAMYEECVNAFRTHWDDRVRRGSWRRRTPSSRSSRNPTAT